MAYAVTLAQGMETANENTQSLKNHEGMWTNEILIHAGQSVFRESFFESVLLDMK